MRKSGTVFGVVDALATFVAVLALALLFAFFLSGCAGFAQGYNADRPGGGGPPLTANPGDLLGWGIGTLLAAAGLGGATCGAGVHVLHRRKKPLEKRLP